MRRYLEIAIIVLGAIAWLEWRQVQGLKRDLEQAEAQLEGYRVADQFRRKLAEGAAGAAALDQELQQGDGADAPLSDYLRHGAGRVWP